MKTKLILFIIIIITQSCSLILNEDELTKERTDYSGKAFRLDGCYVYNLNYKGQYQYNFFYRNGVLFSFNDSSNIEEVNQFHSTSIEYKFRSGWRIFHVENNKINVKYWTEFPSPLKLETATYMFTIVNDTTLSRLNLKGEIGYYYFKKFTSKPDSINIFIK